MILCIYSKGIDPLSGKDKKKSRKASSGLFELRQLSKQGAEFGRPGQRVPP